MDKHELDEKVHDILQHHGVKGMKWGVRRTSEQNTSSNSEGGGGGGGDVEEEDETLLDKLDNVFEAMNKTLSNVSKSVKQFGKKLLDATNGGTFREVKGKERQRLIDSMKNGKPPKVKGTVHKVKLKELKGKDKERFINAMKNGKPVKTQKVSGSWKQLKGKERDKFIKSLQSKSIKTQKIPAGMKQLKGKERDKFIKAMKGK